MNEEFIEEFAEVFDVEPAEMNTSFTFDGPESWDSLAIVSTIALVDQYYDVVLKADDFIHCSNFGELIQLAEGKKGS